MMPIVSSQPVNVWIASLSQRPLARPYEYADDIGHNVDERYLLEVVDELEDALHVLQVKHFPLVEERDLACPLLDLNGDVLCVIVEVVAKLVSWPELVRRGRCRCAAGAL